MVFYFLAVRPWVKDVRKIACIEIAGNKNIQLDGDVRSLTCLMHKKAIPIKSISFEYADSKTSAVAEDDDDDDDEPIALEETLGQTLARCKKGETLEDSLKRRGCKPTKKAPQRRKSLPTLEQQEKESPDKDPSKDKELNKTTGSTKKLRKIKNLVQGKLIVKRTTSNNNFQNDFDPNDFFGVATTTDETLTETSSRLPLDGAAVDDKAQLLEDIPAPVSEIKSCLRVKTLQESLLSSLAAEEEGQLALTSSRRGPAEECKQEEGEQQHHHQQQLLRWGNIVLREYAQCLGDNPACSSGPPVQLDWTYQLVAVVPLNEFEATRQPIRRTNDEQSLKLPSRDRQELLLESGYKPQELAAAVRKKRRDQRRRIQTVSRFDKPLVQSFEERTESMLRIFPTVSMLGKKPPTREAVDSPQQPSGQHQYEPQMLRIFPTMKPPPPHDDVTDEQEEPVRAMTRSLSLGDISC